MRRVCRLVVGILVISCNSQVTFLQSWVFIQPEQLTTAPTHDGARPGTLSPPRPSGIRFLDVAAQAGLTTVPHSHADRRYVVETMAGGGAALFDCDNDGRLDIAVVND